MKPVGKTLGWAMVNRSGSGWLGNGQTRLWHDLRHCAGSLRYAPRWASTVWLISEDAGGRTVSQQLSNQHAPFYDRLKPGKYSLRVSLQGFLPAMERHVRRN